MSKQRASANGEVFPSREGSIVSDLPFVRDTSPEEQKAGMPSRVFWEVQPTGKYGEDCAIGADFALRCLKAMEDCEAPYLMQWAVLDMLRFNAPETGVMVGFLSVFGEFAWDMQRLRSAAVAAAE